MLNFPRADGDVERIEAVVPLVSGMVFAMRMGLFDFDGRDFFHEFFQEGSHNQAGMRGSEAEVGAEAEGDVGVWLPIKADFFGCFENLFIEVRSGPAEGDAAIGRDGVALEIGGDGADAADVGEGHEGPEKFLSGKDETFRICAEGIEIGGVFAEVVDDGGNTVDDGIATAGEGEVGKAHHFLMGEWTALEGGFGKSGEEVVARVGGRFVEGGGEVGFQRWGFPGGVVENMNAPANVSVGLGLGNVEEVGEGAGLDGEREVIDDFDGIIGESVVEEFGDEGLDFLDDLGAFGAFEEWIDDLAVFAVLGRIGFDRELTHGSHVFLGRDGNPEGGVGAKGLPVLGGGTDIGVTEKHGNVFALERALEDAGFLAGFAEGVCWHEEKRICNTNFQEWASISVDFGWCGEGGCL